MLCPCGLEDHPRYIRKLHATWQARARIGPGGCEPIWEVTTWYLDGQYVRFNDESRNTILGSDFYEWEAQLRGLWSDMEDSSIDIDIFFVLPTPPDSPPERLHILILQQIPDSQIGAVVTTYDNFVRDNAPYTSAVFLPQLLYRSAVLSATGRPRGSSPELRSISTRVWYEATEIVDDTPFSARHGQSFIFQIWRPPNNVWDSVPQAEIADEGDEVQWMQLPQLGVGKHSSSLVFGGRSAVNLLAIGSLKGHIPDYLELPLMHHQLVKQELLAYGVHACSPL